MCTSKDGSRGTQAKSNKLMRLVSITSECSDTWWMEHELISHAQWTVKLNVILNLVKFKAFQLLFLN